MDRDGSGMSCVDTIMIALWVTVFFIMFNMATSKITTELSRLALATEQIATTCDDLYSLAKEDLSRYED